MYPRHVQLVPHQRQRTNLQLALMVLSLCWLARCDGCGRLVVDDAGDVDQSSEGAATDGPDAGPVVDANAPCGELPESGPNAHAGPQWDCCDGSICRGLCVSGEVPEDAGCSCGTIVGGCPVGTVCCASFSCKSEGEGCGP